jgi:hypothetical protein
MMSACGGSEQRSRPTLADPGPAPARAQPRDPFARLNEEGLRVVVEVVRADHPELAFLEAQNTYPARPEHALDVLAHAVEDCVDSQLGDYAIRPGTFGRRIGELTFTMTPELARSTIVTAHSTFEQPAFDRCVRDALSTTAITPAELASIDATIAAPPLLRVDVRVTYENGYYVREAAVESVERADVIRFREDDPRLAATFGGNRDVKWMHVAGIRCSADATYLARQLLRGKVLLELDPQTQRGVDFPLWNEVYVRLPDGHDYGLELVRAGVCAPATELHPRSATYQLSTRR